MGRVLTDGLINALNNMNPASLVAQLGTELDNALAGVLPTGSISTDELEDNCVTSAKIADGAATYPKLGLAAPLDPIATKKSNLAATAAPGVSDDGTAGYAVGSQWFDTTNDKVYAMTDPTTGAAVWVELG